MYHVRRKEREIQEPDELRRILKEGRFATLALCRESEPYAVTLSHGYDPVRHCLYFHAALKGHKLDFVAANPRVCASVIEDHGYAAGECSHKYRSVVLRGTMAIVEEPAEKGHAMDVLIRHHEAEPEPVKLRFLSDGKWSSEVVMLRLDIAEMTGKGNC